MTHCQDWVLTRGMCYQDTMGGDDHCGGAPTVLPGSLATGHTQGAGEQVADRGLRSSLTLGLVGLVISGDGGHLRPGVKGWRLAGLAGELGKGMTPGCPAASCGGNRLWS